jgi:vacuolar protein sorting-associated protein 72
MLADKRATRGKRMANLVGEAAEEDETFWNHEIWQEHESDAESYSTEEEKPDVFDSDFNESEDDDEDEDDSDGSDKEATAKVKTALYIGNYI